MERARALGLDHAILVTDEQFAPAVQAATAGQGVDVVLELVGGSYLAEDVRDMVGRRLAAAGMVQREQTRGLSLRVTVRFPAIDAIKAASPRIRLRYLLDRGEVLDAATATLAALVRATELEPVLLLAAARPQVREQLGHIVETLPPPLRQLVAAVDAAVKAVALTVRR